MNTDTTNQPKPTPTPDPTVSQPAPSQSEPLPTTSDPLTGLVGDLQNIDTSSPQASHNETTISDNNGGRIELGEDGRGNNIIRK